MGRGCRTVRELRSFGHERAHPVTVDWKADSGQQWTAPTGGGKIFHLRKLPVNTQLSACYNVVRPDFRAKSQISAQVQFMFPK